MRIMFSELNGAILSKKSNPRLTSASRKEGHLQDNKKGMRNLPRHMPEPIRFNKSLPMRTAFNEILFHGAAYGGGEKEFSRVAVMVFDRLGCTFRLLEVLWLTFEVAAVLCIMTIVVADFICLFNITPPPKISLNRTVNTSRIKTHGREDATSDQGHNNSAQTLLLTQQTFRISFPT
jgi:hypothetical protein